MDGQTPDRPFYNINQWIADAKAREKAAAEEEANDWQAQD